MAKTETPIDVLVLGGHPSAYLAAALLRHKNKARIVHATIPHEAPLDRLVLVNPLLWSLHPLLGGLQKKVEAKAVYGLRFLADDPAISSESRSKAAVGCIAQLRDVRRAMEEMAHREEVEFVAPKQLKVLRADEKGVEVLLGERLVHPTAIVLAGALDDSSHRVLGVPDEWERGVLRRYTFLRLKGTKNVDLGARPVMPMSLDLLGTLSWAWLLPGEKQTQLAVEQSKESATERPPADLLRHWAKVLHEHKVLHEPAEFSDEMIESVELPLAGALAHEGLGNRTLLIGPVGGFYSACAEDVYPTCWSAVYAADVLKKSLKETHLQDALQVYRQKWRTTLGDYLRGPQQNLKFLLPLVYRNQVMTNRLAEAILTGKSVVR